MKLDETDIKILRILQKNSRISNSEISSTINLSVSAVGERIKKLENSGAILQYTAIINGVHFKKELTAFMFISLESPKYNDGFQQFVRKEHSILECHYIVGNYDYLIKIVTETPSTLERVLNKIKSQPGIIKTYTNVVLDTVKNSHSIYPE
ncbi:Lrp/AsnC family transcriptional regulator [Petroclostridium sp. X23]|uniref:Lrp/AsnC family transcriptional regulator n=1 Tax=Petroclostridium sp. X23 TaxID=3045146 RepID=UPI0024AE2622|nr:Lrp/AsnC family transcriptional regulator [Petroclostridium sp. X23]WHH59608.1 Lrp/AsnC family transcriptional regulator [Petroclostridium sp. X23]